LGRVREAFASNSFHLIDLQFGRDHLSNSTVIRQGRTVSTREFKSNAWKSNDTAERYHSATVAAPRLFQFIREDLFIRRIKRYVDPGARILDLGCGSGLIAIALHDLGYQVVACDVSQGMLDVLARERGARQFELRRGDGLAIPAVEQEFDLVVSRMFIQHFSEWPRVLAEKARVTRPGGVVIFDFGNQEHVDASGLRTGDGSGFPYFDDPTSPARFYANSTTQAMRREADALGLDVVEISPAGLLLYNVFLWERLKADGIAELNKTLERILESSEARDLLAIFEETLAPLLPPSVTYGNITVLRRR
jgi:ubiquinone/menaquinone biosynthesis C-methylase UbiE